MSNISLTGNIVRDMDLRTTQNGVPFCRGTVAVNKKSGENESTSYVDFIAYRSLAENLVASLSKGDRIVVVGRIETYSQEMETTDGVKNITKAQVVADSVGPDLRWASASVTRNPRAASASDEASSTDEPF